MNARFAIDWVRSFGRGSQVTCEPKPLPEPELLKPKARPMTGLFASLSAEQKKAILGYKGLELVGDDAFKRVR